MDISTYISENYDVLKKPFINWCYKNLNCNDGDKDSLGEEMFQECLTNALCTAHTKNFENEEKIKGYIWVILRNHVFAYNKSRKKGHNISNISILVDGKDMPNTSDCQDEKVINNVIDEDSEKDFDQKNKEDMINMMNKWVNENLSEEEQIIFIACRTEPSSPFGWLYRNDYLDKEGKKNKWYWKKRMRSVNTKLREKFSKTYELLFF